MAALAAEVLQLRFLTFCHAPVMIDYTELVFRSLRVYENQE